MRIPAQGIDPCGSARAARGTGPAAVHRREHASRGSGGSLALGKRRRCVPRAGSRVSSVRAPGSFAFVGLPRDLEKLLMLARCRPACVEPTPTALPGFIARAGLRALHDARAFARLRPRSWAMWCASFRGSPWRGKGSWSRGARSAGGIQQPRARDRGGGQRPDGAILAFVGAVQ